MKKINTFLHVEVPYFWGQVLYGFKFIMVEVMIVLMAFGVLYVTNFRISINPVVTTISPIVEGAK